jgi:hypothetical protein
MSIDSGKKIQRLIRRQSIVFTFCNSSVNPDEITQVLDIKPTYALRVGEVGHYYWNDQTFISSVGKWQLVNIEFEELNSLEEKLVAWSHWLHSIRPQIQTLLDAGYQPYLSCSAQAVKKNLSVCIAPELMKSFAESGVSLCIG